MGVSDGKRIPDEVPPGNHEIPRGSHHEERGEKIWGDIIVIERIVRTSMTR